MPAVELTMADFEEGYDRISVLNWGPPKTGKTRSVFTLLKAGFGPIWLEDFDYGPESLINAARAAKYSGDDIRIFRYTAGIDRIKDTQHRNRQSAPALDFFRHINNLYDHVDPKDPKNWKPEAIEAKKVPGTIVIDSLTTLADQILDFTLVLEGHELGAPKTDARSDFGKQMSKIVEIITSILALPCSFVMLAHEKVTQDDTTGTIRCDPMVTGQLASVIADYFGIVIYSHFSGGKYMWLTQPENYVKVAGTRYTEGLQARIEQDYSLLMNRKKTPKA